MKRLLVSLSLVLALFTGVSASVQYDTTFGVFLNEIDNIADPIYIFDNQNNVLSFGSRLLSDQTSYANATWEFAFGLAKGLPLTLGITGNFRANNSGTPDYRSNWTYTLDPLWAGDSNITATYTTENFNGSFVAFNIVGGLKLGNMPLGIRWAHVAQNNVSNKNYGVVDTGLAGFAANPLNAGGSTVNNIIQSNSSTFIYGAYTLNGPGFADNTSLYNTIEAAMKMGNMSIYMPLNISLTPIATGLMDRKGMTTVFDSWPSNAVTTTGSNTRMYVENGREWLIGVDPAVYIQMNDNMLLWADLSLGFGLINSTVRQYTEYGMTTAGNTNYNDNTNTQSYDGYLHIPVSLRVGPELYAKAGGLKVGGKFIARGYLDFKTFTDKTVLEQWSRDALNPGTITYVKDLAYYTTNQFQMGLDISIPVGVEYAFNSVFSTRFGAQYTYNLSSTTSSWGNSYSIVTTEVTATPIVTNTPPTDPGSPSYVNTVSSSSSLFQLYFGMGFAFSENFVLDIRAITDLSGSIFTGALLDFASYEADLRFMF